MRNGGKSHFADCERRHSKAKSHFCLGMPFNASIPSSRHFLPSFLILNQKSGSPTRRWRLCTRPNWLISYVFWPCVSVSQSIYENLYLFNTFWQVFYHYRKYCREKRNYKQNFCNSKRLCAKPDNRQKYCNNTPAKTVYYSCYYTFIIR